MSSALAQPDRVDGDPVSGHAGILPPFGHLTCRVCGWKSAEYDRLTPEATAELHRHWDEAHPEMVGRPAPPAVTHTGPQ